MKIRTICCIGAISCILLSSKVNAVEDRISKQEISESKNFIVQEIKRDNINLMSALNSHIV